MPSLPLDHFLRYDELTALLQAYAAEHPNLVRLEALGKSHEGRDIWLVTVTNFASGPANEKPAIWLSANIHASEVTGSAAALNVLHQLVTRYGAKEDVTRSLDTRAFYIVPRINPDGAEWALADRPRLIRSSTRPYPYDEEAIEGMQGTEDIDGDGRLLTMRIPDPNGFWKAHPDDPRLMMLREPTETGGKYYRLLPEGYLHNYDGVTIKVQPPKPGLDLNRNFPMEWRGESEQKGAGPFPTSEPEVRAITEFVAAHPNLTLFVDFHTFSGVLLRPYASRADETFPPEDLWIYQKLGKKGTEITGYPNISIFHDFKYHPKQVITGGSDYLYEHLGVFWWAVEFWSPMRQAGIENYKFIDWFRDHPVEDDLKLIKWNDEVLEGKAFVNWYPYEHPQLGPVELGGWDFLHYWTNVPLHLLEKEIAPFADWMIWQSLISPLLRLRESSVTPLGGGNYRLRVVVENCGWLPTNVTKKALEKKATRGLIAELTLPEDAHLATGLPRQDFGQLEGWAHKELAFTSQADPSNDRAKLEWVVHAPQGGTVGVEVRHERAGVIRLNLKLE